MLLSTQRVLKKMKKSSVSVSSKQQISPSFWKAGGRVWILSRQGAAWFDIVVYSDPVEVVFVYQRVGGLSSYDRVFLAPVNIFS